MIPTAENRWKVHVGLGPQDRSFWHQCVSWQRHEKLVSGSQEEGNQKGQSAGVPSSLEARRAWGRDTNADSWGKEGLRP